MSRIILTIILYLCCIVNAYAGAFNGSGTFVRSYSWTNDAANGIPITASRFDTEDNGYATGLSQCITKDGQQTITGNIPFNSFRITGAGNPVNLQDYVTTSAILNTTLNFCSTSGTNTIALTSNPLITAYTQGQVFYFAVASTNTGAVTINIDSLGAKALYQPSIGGPTPLVGGELQANTMTFVMYDGTEFQLLSPSSNIKGATSAGTSGYTTLPTGIIIQWGTASVTAGTVTHISLPLTFPNHIYNATASGFSSSTTATVYVDVNPVSTSDLDVIVNTGTGAAIYWQAIGN